MTTIELCRLNSRAILLFIFVDARRWYGADFMVLWSRRDAKSLLTTQNAIFFLSPFILTLAASNVFHVFVRLRQSICFMQISRFAFVFNLMSSPRRNRTEKIPRFIEFCLRFAVFIELFNSDYLCLCQTLPSSPLCSRKNCNLHLIIPHLTHLTFGDTFSSLLLTRLKCFSFFL